MADSSVRTIGQVEDIDGQKVTVGVDYDSVTISGPARLGREALGEFARLYNAAVWHAGENAERERSPVVTAPAEKWLNGQYELLLSAREKIRHGATHLLTDAEADALARRAGSAVHLCMFSLKTDTMEKPMTWYPRDEPGPLDGKAHP